MTTFLVTETSVIASESVTAKSAHPFTDKFATVGGSFEMRGGVFVVPLSARGDRFPTYRAWDSPLSFLHSNDSLRFLRGGVSVAFLCHGQRLGLFLGWLGEPISVLPFELCPATLVRHPDGTSRHRR